MEVLDDFRRLLFRCPFAGDVGPVRALLETEVRWRSFWGTLLFEPPCPLVGAVVRHPQSATRRPPIPTPPSPAQPSQISASNVVHAVQACLLDERLVLPALTVLRRYILPATSTLVRDVLRHKRDPSLEISCALAAVLRLVGRADRCDGRVAGRAFGMMLVAWFAKLSANCFYQKT